MILKGWGFRKGVRSGLVFGAEAIGEAGPVMPRLAMLARDRVGRCRAGLAGSAVLAFGELVPACEAAVPGPCPWGPLRSSRCGAYALSGRTRSACVTVSGAGFRPETVMIMVSRLPARR